MSLAAMAVALSAAGQEKHTTEIKSQTYEKWWGLKVSENFAQPFSHAFTVNTAEKDPLSYTANVLLSNKGRYVWSDSPMKVSFADGQLTVTSEAEKVEARKGGSSLREAYLVMRHKHSSATPSALSPDIYSLPLYELEDKLVHTQEAVIQFASKVAAHKYPKGYVIVPHGWRNPGTTMEFSSGDYPSPHEMVSSLHGMGFKVMLSISPYVPANGRNYVEFQKAGLLETDSAGKPTVVETESGYYACLKMTEEAVETINAHLKALHNKYGIDGFYVDFREAYRLHAKQPALQAEYAAMWSKACEGVENVVMTCSPNLDTDAAFGFGMAAEASWAGMKQAVSMSLKSSLFGKSAFAYTPVLDVDDAVTVRAVQLALMMPVAVVPSAAWNLTNAGALKSMLEWRKSIGDYMARTAEESAVTAEPVMRSLEYQFGGSTFYTCEDEFMLGSKYLVAPVLEESRFRMVRLPRGTWRAPGGEKFRGPRIVNVNVDNSGYAVFELQ